MKTYQKARYLTFAIIASAGTFLTASASAAAAEAPREELTHAYRLLQRANSDYAGHKAKAMDDIAAADKLLGLTAIGELPERERQWKSDEQLREARRLLGDVREKMEARDRERIAVDLDAAITQLDDALKVK